MDLQGRKVTLDQVNHTIIISRQVRFETEVSDSGGLLKGAGPLTGAKRKATTQIQMSEQSVHTFSGTSFSPSPWKVARLSDALAPRLSDSICAGAGESAALNPIMPKVGGTWPVSAQPKARTLDDLSSSDSSPDKDREWEDLWDSTEEHGYNLDLGEVLDSNGYWSDGSLDKHSSSSSSLSSSSSDDFSDSDSDC